jgi:hypothetical protein
MTFSAGEFTLNARWPKTLTSFSTDLVDDFLVPIIPITIQKEDNVHKLQTYQYYPQITTLIINDTKNHKYPDQSKKTTGVFRYYGQKSGRDDHRIIPDRTLYLEKNGSAECVYRGLITNKKKMYPRTPHSSAIYELSLDTDYIHNNIKSGETLYYHHSVSRGRGSYCYNKSAAIRLGFSIESGNFAAGIIFLR